MKRPYGGHERRGDTVEWKDVWLPILVGIVAVVVCTMVGVRI